MHTYELKERRNRTTDGANNYIQMLLDWGDAMRVKESLDFRRFYLFL